MSDYELMTLRADLALAVSQVERVEAERDKLRAELAAVKAQELLTRSLAEEAHAIIAAMALRPDLCHKPDCEVHELRAWAPGQKLPTCDCGAWELQGRIEALAAARDVRSEVKR